jgi:hypothetical protein
MFYLWVVTHLNHQSKSCETAVLLELIFLYGVCSWMSFYPSYSPDLASSQFWQCTEMKIHFNVPSISQSRIAVATDVTSGECIH